MEGDSVTHHEWSRRPPDAVLLGQPCELDRPVVALGDDAAVAGWIERALAFASAMPPKQPKAKKTS